MSKKSNRKLKKTIALVGDGESEFIYFNQIKEEYRTQNLEIYPHLPTKKYSDFKKVFSKVDEFVASEFDEIYAIIVLDTIINNNLQVEYLNAKRSFEKISSSKIIIIEIYPCFELWILLHYKCFTNEVGRCNDILKELKKIPELKAYSKNSESLKKMNIFGILKEKLPTAIQNAKELDELNIFESYRFPKCDFYKVIERFVHS